MHDTLRYVKKLEAIGVSRQLAEAQVEIMADMVDKNFATKNDLATSFALLKSDLDTRFARVSADVDARFARAAGEFDVKIANLERNLTIRMGIMLVASTTLTITILGFLHH